MPEHFKITARRFGSDKQPAKLETKPKKESRLVKYFRERKEEKDSLVKIRDENKTKEIEEKRSLINFAREEVLNILANIILKYEKEQKIEVGKQGLLSQKEFDSFIAEYQSDLLWLKDFKKRCEERKKEIQRSTENRKKKLSQLSNEELQKGLWAYNKKRRKMDFNEYSFEEYKSYLKQEEKDTEALEASKLGHKIKDEELAYYVSVLKNPINFLLLELTEYLDSKFKSFNRERIEEGEKEISLDEYKAYILTKERLEPVLMDRLEKLTDSRKFESFNEARAKKGLERVSLREYRKLREQKWKSENQFKIWQEEEKLRKTKETELKLAEQKRYQDAYKLEKEREDLNIRVRNSIEEMKEEEFERKVRKAKKIFKEKDE